MQSFSAPAAERVVVILATGGTIAGTAVSPGDSLGYRAARLGIEDLVAALPARSHTLETEQVAQLDSKDMEVEVWRRLTGRVSHHLQRPEVAGVVCTHGTDTMEETAYWLQRVLAPGKPVVLTGAMRPATSLQADGPQNLLDAVTLALEPSAAGVLVVCAGTAHSAFDVRKTHTHLLDAFGSGDAGPVARIEAGRVRRLRDWPQGKASGTAGLNGRTVWPRVEIVLSHAGASGRLVDALVAQGIDGLIAAGTGNGTLHHALEAALLRAQRAGVAVRRASRVPAGPLLDAGPAELPASVAHSAVQARIELMLELMDRR